MLAVIFRASRCSGFTPASLFALRFLPVVEVTVRRFVMSQLTTAFEAYEFQLHPWLVPHSVQTPQAPARTTLSEPQLEQVMSMNILPSAS